MFTLRYDEDITKSPEFRLRGKATIEIISRQGYINAYDPATWLSEEDMIQSLLEDEDVHGDVNLARNKIMYSGEILRRDRQETTIELYPGSNFRYGYSNPTEEGYSSYGIQVEWNSDLDGWDVEVTNGGRDCDGEYRRDQNYSVDADGKELEKNTSIYDENAQRAGY